MPPHRHSETRSVERLKGTPGRNRQVSDASELLGTLGGKRDALKILAVLGLGDLGSQRQQLGTADPTLTVRDLLDRGDLRARRLLDDADELARVEELVNGAGTEPGKALGQRGGVELLVVKVHLVEIRDLKLAARGRLELLGVLDDLVIVDVKTSGDASSGFSSI